MKYYFSYIIYYWTYQIFPYFHDRSEQLCQFRLSASKKEYQYSACPVQPYIKIITISYMKRKISINFQCHRSFLLHFSQKIKYDRRLFNHWSKTRIQSSYPFALVFFCHYHGWQGDQCLALKTQSKQVPKPIKPAPVLSDSRRSTYRPEIMLEWHSLNRR